MTANNSPLQQNRQWPSAATDYGVSQEESLLRAGDFYYNTVTLLYRKCDDAIFPAQWSDVAPGRGITGEMQSVGTSNNSGASDHFAPIDHRHGHSNLGGGSLHAAATTDDAGFMSSSDKTKLNGVTAGADPTLATLAAATSVVVGLPGSANVQLGLGFQVVDGDANYWDQNSDAGGHRILNLPTPADPQEPATKAYVDAAMQGLTIKPAVRAVATANVASLSGTTTVDGVLFIAGDRVLLTAQSTASQNGPWLVAAGAWTRPTDFDAAADVTYGAWFLVREGTTYADTSWALVTDGTINVGVTSLSFTQATAAGQIAAGTGLTKTGLTLAANFGASGDIAAVGRAASAGASGKVADAAHVHDGGAITVQTKSASFTLANTDNVVHIDATSGVVQITLPAASARRWTIKKTAGINKITLLSGGVSIEGVAANFDLPGSYGVPRAIAPLSWELWSDGTSWFVRGSIDPVLAQGLGVAAYREDFLGNMGVTGTAWQAQVSGTGAAISPLGTVAGHPGIAELFTGTTTTGRTTMYYGASTAFRIGTDAFVFQAVVDIETLSTVAEEYLVFLGATVNLPAEPTDGIYFLYDRLNRGTNWIACTASASSRTRTDTGVAVGAGSWVLLEIVINAAASSIGYYINGALVATITTNIPGATALWAWALTILKSAGTTTRSVRCDYTDIQQYLTTPRG